MVLGLILTQILGSSLVLAGKEDSKKRYLIRPKREDYSTQAQYAEAFFAWREERDIANVRARKHRERKKLEARGSDRLVQESRARKESGMSSRCLCSREADRPTSRRLSRALESSEEKASAGPEVAQSGVDHRFERDFLNDQSFDQFFSSDPAPWFESDEEDLEAVAIEVTHLFDRDSNRPQSDPREADAAGHGDDETGELEKDPALRFMSPECCMEDLEREKVSNLCDPSQYEVLGHFRPQASAEGEVSTLMRVSSLFDSQAIDTSSGHEEESAGVRASAARLMLSQDPCLNLLFWNRTASEQSASQSVVVPGEAEEEDDEESLVSVL